MSGSISISGFGLVTPLGPSACETWEALLAGQYIRDHARVPFDAAKPRAAALGLRAAEEAVAHAGWAREELGDDATALVIGTSKGEIVSWLASSLDVQIGIGLWDVAATVATEMGLGMGPRITVSAACASGLHALIRAAMMLRGGEARRALVVATEASVHPLFVGSFRRLGVLAPEGVGCRPFDEQRQGFLMSEAAAGVCLEASEFRGLAGVERFAVGGDANHLTAGDPSGATLRRLLKHVVQDRSVDLIHAHGTGTELNDPVELAAIESMLPTSQHMPSVYAHKGALGHSLGAAGLMSVVLNCLAHQHEMVPPNVQTHRPLPCRRVSLCREAVQRPIRRSIAIAAGFGGPVAVVSLVHE